MRIIRPLLMLIIVIALGASCRKELCYNHPHDGSVTVNVDWKNLPSESKKPAGVRVVFIDQPNQELNYSFNFSPEGGSRDLSQGNYNILVVNNDPEYVLFRNMTKWETMEAFTPAKRQNPYKSSPSNVPNKAPSKARVGISPPDILVSSNSEKVFITENSTEKYVVTATPKSYVKTITVRIPVSGIGSLSEARGFLTGVSPSVFLGKDSLSQSDGLLLFEYGSAMAGTELRAQFYVFGMVDKPEGFYKLGLELLLIDQSSLYYEFDVSGKITAELKKNGGNIALDQTIIIPVVDPVDPGGGFKPPTIQGWDDEEDIVLGNI